MLAEFSVKRWQFTLVAFGALLALGVHALLTIPKAEDPTFPIPNFRIVAVLPGASPQDLERLVVDPVEAKLSVLEDLKTLKSEIRSGLAVIFAEFRAETDAEEKNDELLREINALRPTLPDQLRRLDVYMYNAADVHVLELALVGEHSTYDRLDVVARRFKRRLEGVSGVGDVELVGLPDREVTVELDMARMVASDISPREVYRAIAADSRDIPAGSIDIGPRRFNVAAGAEYETLDDLRETVVRARNGAPVRVKDIARVSLGDAEATHIARFDGKRAVLIAVAVRDGQSIFRASERLDAELEDLEAELPSSIALRRGFAQVTNVARRMDSFTADFAIAIGLVLVTLLPLGLRASSVVMVSIPLSLSIGLFLLKAVGFSLNQLSLVGLVLALGLLVDDSVVVVENITRHIRQGVPPKVAAVRGTKEIATSVLGCTVVLVLAFVPLLALPGSSGQFIRPMPLALVFTVAASLLVSFTIVPFLSSLVLRPTPEAGNPLFRAVVWLVEGAYRHVLERAVAWPITTLIVVGLIFLGSLALIPKVGFSLFPKADIPQFLVKVEAAEGASLAETDRAVRYAESVLSKHSEVTRVASTVGKGHPQIYYNVQPAWERANVGQVFAQAPRAPETRQRLFAELRRELDGFPGAHIELFEFQNGPNVEAPIALRLESEDDEALRRAAAEVERVLGTTSGTRDVSNPLRQRRTDLRMEVDREKAALVGVFPPDAEQVVRLAVAGIAAGTYRDDAADEPYAIRLTVPRATNPIMGRPRPGMEVLQALHVPNERGRQVPLSQVASFSFEPSPTTVRHYDRERCATVTSYVKPGFNVAKVTQDVLSRLETTPLPAKLVPAGELRTRSESFGGLSVALIVTAFGILGVLVLEFGTFKSTAIVASSIPLGVIGGVLALWLSGNTFSFVATIGFIALMGIEVRNSILLVDFTNQLRREGVELDEAIRRAGETRFVPVLLTTLTAIGGLIPLILSRSNLYSPLAWVILGGLLSSTLLTRIVTPVLYKLLAPKIASESQGDLVVVAAEAAAAGE